MKRNLSGKNKITIISLTIIAVLFLSALAFLPSPASAIGGCDCADYGVGWYDAPFWGGCDDCTTNPVYPSQNCAPCGQAYAYCDGCNWDTSDYRCAGSVCCECSGVGYQVAPFWDGCSDCTSNPVYPNYNIEPCGQAYAYCDGCKLNRNWDTHKCEGSYNPCYDVSCPDYCSASARYYGGYCSGGNCYYSSTDCGSNSCAGNYYCTNDDPPRVYETCYSRGCSAGYCYDNSYASYVVMCDYACVSGKCDCGDGVCEYWKPGYENCGNCYNDCPCSSGYVCVSGQCVLACSNECTSGTTRCLSSSTRQTCGNYDADACLEWGSDYACPYGCSGGECITTGTCTCEGCRDNDCTTFLRTDNCNTPEKYHPVCADNCGTAPYCIDALTSVDCTCVKNPECSDSGDCSNRAGSYSDTYQSYDCFNCNSGSCSFSSEGTQCTINFAHCLGLTGCPSTGTKYGSCSGSYCTCWEGMSCENNERCELCSNSYCTSGHCCAKGSEWKTTPYGHCESYNPCYPKPPYTCQFAPFTPNWFTDLICVSPSAMQACCYLGAMYGYADWYDWLQITPI